MKVKVIDFRASFNGGVLGLTEEQAAVRSHKLQVVSKGKYQVLSPVEFKAGEVIEIEGEIPKEMIGQLEEVKRGRKAEGSEE